MRYEIWDMTGDVSLYDEGEFSCSPDLGTTVASVTVHVLRGKWKISSRQIPEILFQIGSGITKTDR